MSILLTITPGVGTTSHIIERSVDNGVSTSLISLNMPIVTYTDRDVTAGHEYAYRAIAYQGVVASAPSASWHISLTVNPSTISGVEVP